VCQNIYISSQKELPEVTWNEQSPGFCFIKVTHKGELKMLNPILNSQYIYEAISHMGCSCGLSYGDWSLKDQREDHKQRVKDVMDLKDYLELHKNGNTIQIFSTMWDKFPDQYDEKEFKTSAISGEEFEFDEMVILNVV
jgi:hypothetical protein